MKIGDLVEYIEDGVPPEDPSQGIIVRGPEEGWSGNNPTQRYEVMWYSCENKTGWWDKKDMRVISESR